jgi:hypothetical protein
MTSTAPTTVRITDLADPQRTDALLARLSEAEHHPVELTVEAVLDSARNLTGLTDFGPEDFRERMALRLNEVDAHKHNTAFGRLEFFQGMARTVANRQKILNLLKLHPEIREVEVKRPIFIVGMPRSGTTDLVNTLAADSRFRTMPNWEGGLVPDNLEQRLGPGEEDPRLVRARARWEADLGLLPYRELMHPTNPYFLDEAPGDGPDVPVGGWRGMGLAWSREMLNWRRDADRWLEFDQKSRQTPRYTWARTGIQILQWYRPGERYLGKATGQMGDVGALLRQFPDATIVFTHRDPVAVVQSAATMICYRARMFYTRVDPSWYLDFYKGLVHRLLKAYLENRHLAPKEQSIDILFHERIADEMGFIEKIYQLAEFPLTAAARAEIEQAYTTRARGFVPWEQGKVVYDLRADFGADPVSIRREFDYYFDALPVKVEVI